MIQGIIEWRVEIFNLGMKGFHRVELLGKNEFKEALA